MGSIRLYSGDDGESHIERINDHYLLLQPEAQALFRAGLKKAKVPDTFREAVMAK